MPDSYRILTKYVFGARNNKNVRLFVKENNWSITVTAKTLEELKEKAAHRIFKSGIEIEYGFIGKCPVVVESENNSEYFLVDADERGNDFDDFKKDCFNNYEYSKFLSDVLCSDTYKELVEEYKIQLVLGIIEERYFMLPLEVEDGEKK